MERSKKKKKGSRIPSPFPTEDLPRLIKTSSSVYDIVVMEHTVAVCLTQQKYVEVNSCYAYNQYAEQARKLSAIA